MGVTEIFNFRLIAIFHYINSLKSAQLVTTFASSAKNPTDQKKVSLCFFFYFSHCDWRRLSMKIIKSLFFIHWKGDDERRADFFYMYEKFFFTLLDHLFWMKLSKGEVNKRKTIRRLRRENSSSVCGLCCGKTHDGTTECYAIHLIRSKCFYLFSSHTLIICFARADLSLNIVGYR